MRVIFTCGGTGGHINPALAVAKLLQTRQPESEILFLGAAGGMEETLVPREGFRLETLQVSNFQRRLSPAAIGHNLKTAVNILDAMRQAKRLIRDFSPDVIVGTGGYASFPALRQGTRMGIPTAIHESNAVPGLTTRMVADQVDRIMVCFAESKACYTNADRVRVVGMPVREEFIYRKRADARRALGLDERPLIVSCWGSLGAREMNKKIAEFFQLELQCDAWQHVHATGSYGWRWMPDYVQHLGVDLSKHPNIDMREYIYNMPDLMAAADVIICRGGSSTLNEVAAAGTPCIIVPSPNATDNHQEKNARILEKRGAAEVVLEPQCTAQMLYDRTKALLESPERRSQMRKALGELAVVDATERIYQTILELTNAR